MRNKEFVQQLICKQKILPLYYDDSAETSMEILKVLYDAGIRIVEYTNRGTNALDNFMAMRKAADAEMPELVLGAGTIKTAVDAQLFVTAGADFIVCPVVNTDVANVVHKANLLWIPGCMTATEIFTAETNGATIVKIFPGNILGPGYTSALKELFTDLLFMPTGGIEISKENLSAWFNAGVCAVGLGSKLVSKSITEKKDYAQLTALAKQTLNIVQGFW